MDFIEKVKNLSTRITNQMFRSFLLSILVLFVAIYSMGCEGGREDILSLSQYSISLISA